MLDIIVLLTKTFNSISAAFYCQFRALVLPENYPDTQATFSDLSVHRTWSYIKMNSSLVLEMHAGRCYSSQHTIRWKARTALHTIRWKEELPPRPLRHRPIQKGLRYLRLQFPSITQTLRRDFSLDHSSSGSSSSQYTCASSSLHLTAWSSVCISLALTTIIF